MCLASIPVGVAAKTAKGCATTSSSSQIVTTVKESKGTRGDRVVSPNADDLPEVDQSPPVLLPEEVPEEEDDGIDPASQVSVGTILLAAMQNAEAIFEEIMDRVEAASATSPLQAAVRLMRVPPRRFVQVLILLAHALYHVSYIWLIWKVHHLEARVADLQARVDMCQAQLDICQTNVSIKSLIAKMFSKD